MEQLKVTRRNFLLTILLTSGGTIGEKWLKLFGSDPAHAIHRNVNTASPIANAGSDFSVPDIKDQGGVHVTLDGSKSTYDGALQKFIWKENATVIGTGTYPEVFLAIGTHTISLVVTDDAGLISEDSVQVTVLPNNSIAPATVSESYETVSFCTPADILTTQTMDWASGSQIATYLNTDSNGNVTRTFSVIVLDNGLISVTIAPELGGRILQVLDKTQIPHREMFQPYIDPANPVPFAQNIGGIKPSFPYAENSTPMIDSKGNLHCKAGYYIEQYPDGSAAAIMNLRFGFFQDEADSGFLGKYGDKILTCIVTLLPGHIDFTVKYISENPNPCRRNNRIWSVCTYPNVYGSQGQWLFPTKYAIGHSAESLFDIQGDGPLDDPSQALEQYGSYFALYPQYPFSGAYYRDADANHLRVNDPVKYPGCKIYNYKTNSDPFELWGSTNVLFEAPESFLDTFETNDLVHQYYLIQGLGKIEYADASVAITIQGSRFKVTAPFYQNVDIYPYNNHTDPILTNRTIGPSLFVTGIFTEGIRIVSQGKEVCNLRLPLTYENNFSRYAEIKASADRSGGSGLGILDASHGYNYELEDLACKPNLLSSLSALIAINNFDTSMNPDLLVSMARTAYRHGGFSTTEQYLNLLENQRNDETKYLRSLMNYEQGLQADFSKTLPEGRYFEALLYVSMGESNRATSILKNYLAQKPNVLRPRLLYAYLTQNADEALQCTLLNPGSIESWTVLKELNYPSAADKLNGLLKQNEIATTRMNDFLSEIKYGVWKHERRYEYNAGWYEKVSMPDFPNILKYSYVAPAKILITHPINLANIEDNHLLIGTRVIGMNDITYVEFYDNGLQIGKQLQWPFCLKVSNLTSGVHTLTVKAYRSGGSIVASEPVMISVN